MFLCFRNYCINLCHLNVLPFKQTTSFVPVTAVTTSMKVVIEKTMAILTSGGLQ